MITIVTGAAWTFTIWLSSFAVFGRSLGGDWSRVLILGLLILAGIGTIVLAVAQVWVPIATMCRIAYDTGKEDERRAMGGDVVNLEVHRVPRTSSPAGQVPSPVGSR